MTIAETFRFVKKFLWFKKCFRFELVFLEERHPEFAERSAVSRKQIGSQSGKGQDSFFPFSISPVRPRRAPPLDTLHGIGSGRPKYPHFLDVFVLVAVRVRHGTEQYLESDLLTRIPLRSKRNA